MKGALSKYTRIFNFTVGSVLLYNTSNCNTLEIDRNLICNETRSVHLRDRKIAKELQSGGFLKHFVPIGPILKRYEFRTLIISLEIFTACNLKCPYCYQINDHLHRGVISDADLDYLYQYVMKVHERTGFSTLVLKVLGGEPSVNFKPAMAAILKLSDLCNSKNIKFRLKIDTNLTKIDDFCKIPNDIDTLYTIPLSYKECHNRLRYFDNGTGTYDMILDNCVKLREVLPESKIILRYNLDHENKKWFEEYVSDVKQRLPFSPIITAQYTTNPEFGNFKNHLTYQQYVDFMSTNFIDVLAKYNLPISVVPMYLLGYCQRISKYSIKLFSDGKVGACAMDFFRTDNPDISILANDINAVEHYWNGVKTFSLFDNKKCLNCKSLFVCGGHYNLDCIQELNLTHCQPETSLYLDLEKFAGRLHKLRNEGKGELFIGINNLSLFK